MEKLTQEELDALPQKTKKDQFVVDLYRTHDFLTAYAKHTDYRVKTAGVEGAIGDHTEWESYGELQCAFLIGQGLKPGHTLLDVGCGTGRLSRKVVPYLNPSRYIGYDISTGALSAARDIAFGEGWYSKNPEFVSSLSGLVEPFDYLWAFSVFIHVPVGVMRDTFAQCRRLMHEQSRFYMSYVPEKRDERTGLKQFRRTFETYVETAEREGLSFEPVEWPGKQKMALCRVLWRAMA